MICKVVIRVKIYVKIKSKLRSFGNVQILNGKEKEEPTLPSFHRISNSNTRIWCPFSKNLNQDSAKKNLQRKIIKGCRYSRIWNSKMPITTCFDLATLTKIQKKIGKEKNKNLKSLWQLHKDARTLYDNDGKINDEGKVFIDIQARYLPILIIEFWLNSWGKVIPEFPMWTHY